MKKAKAKETAPKIRGKIKPKNVLKVLGKPVEPLITSQEFYRACGREIHRARLSRDLTREQLAELTGYTVNSIKGIEVRGRGMSHYRWWLFKRVLDL